MKLQTGANKEDEYDLGEDEDQPESEDNDGKYCTLMSHNFW